jgi:hypothetical protein
MTVGEIAKKLCEHAYLKQCEDGEEGEAYSFEEYWERNKNYFIGKAAIYLEVKEFLATE